MKGPYFKSAFAKAGVDTTRGPSETEPLLAKDAIYYAAVNCELQKARAEVRAKMIVKNLRADKKGGGR